MITNIDDNKHISIKWQIGPTRVPEPNPDKASDITILFEKVSDSKTDLKFTHMNFENHGKGHEKYQQAMNSEQGWDYILNCYKSYCEKTR